MSRPPQSPLVVRPQAEARRWTRLPRVASTHDERSRALIVETSELANPCLAVIVGAGKCDDIPLDHLAGRFERVLLFDEDRAALDEGIDSARLDSARRAKLATEVGDLTGVAEQLAAAIRVELERGSLPASDNANSWIDNLATIVDRDEPLPRASTDAPDFVVVSCVLSQLHVTAVHRALAEIEIVAASAGRPELAAAVRQSPRFTEALLSLARRMEDRFVDDLARQLASGGVAYISDTVQMCFVRLLPDGDWASDGLYRMTRTPQLADYFDGRFAIEPLGEWAWVVEPPVKPEDLGRVYRVQALRARLATI